MTDENVSRRSEIGVASNYIIALGGNLQGTFVICQPTLVIDRGENWGGLTAEQIYTYIKQHMLHAAPLPGRPLEPLEFLAGPGR